MFIFVFVLICTELSLQTFEGLMPLSEKESFDLPGEVQLWRGSGLCEGREKEISNLGGKRKSEIRAPVV